MAFAWASKVRIPLWALIVLALTVWAIYVADRLLDARRGIGTGKLSELRERHFFHLRFSRMLAPAAVLAIVCAACIVFAEMPAVIFERDSVVAAAALAYLRGVHFRSQSSPGLRNALARLLTKELLVGILFAAGCALPAWNRASSPAAVLALPVAVFAALAWLDCHAIDRWEHDPDARQKNGIVPAACRVGLFAALTSMLVASHQPRAAELLIAGAVSALLFALLDRIRHRMTPLALRAVTDLVLLTPLALVLR